MYYVTRDAVGVAKCAVLALLFCALSTASAISQDKPKRYLIVKSQGYSRYEISEGDVVAFFTGGIECSYLDYTLSADELRYNHATEVANASGNVKLTSAVLSLECDAVDLDGKQGTLLIASPLDGTLADRGLRFRAGQAAVHFPPGQMDVDLKHISLQLDGTAECALIVQGPNASVLQAQQLTFEGATGSIASTGPFELAAEIDAGDSSADAPGLDITHAVLTGAALTGTLDELGMLQSAVIEDAQLDAGQVKLSAPELKLALEQLSSETAESYVIEADGSPISGEAVNGEQSVSFIAEHVHVASNAKELERIDLSGHVAVSTAGSNMKADLIQLERRAKGFAISAPQGLQVAFDLAALSGSTPVELPSLESFMQQE